jgi:hypothetical protein
LASVLADERNVSTISCDDLEGTLPDDLWRLTQLTTM